MRHLYSVLMYALTPLLLLRLFWRSRRAPAYARRIAERFGFFKAPTPKGSIWIHAVSVGETLAAIPLIKKIQSEFPAQSIVVTTMTPTGSAQVRQQLGNSVFHVYAPYDLPCAWQRFLKKIAPRLLIIMETELWPNLLHQMRINQIPVVVANARLSEKSARGYQKIAVLMRGMLNAITQLCAQYPEDGKRFLELGLDSAKLTVSGSIKFDITVNPDLIEKGKAVRALWGHERCVWIAASTHEGEEELLLKTYQILKVQHKNLLLVLVPRHPERFAKVITLAKAYGRVSVRSQQQIVDDQTDIIVADTMGELLLLYATADIAFVGGSLVATGGHNLLEPAALGLPIMSGEHTFNFSQIAQMLKQHHALCEVTAENLTTTMDDLINHSQKRSVMGQAALQVVNNNKGALNRLW